MQVISQFPVLPFAGYVERQIAPYYIQWKLDYEKTLPKFEIENIRFEHDPLWNQRLMSIQSAHDGNHPFWAVCKVIFGPLTMAI